jgi:hypothetical protein
MSESQVGSGAFVIFVLHIFAAEFLAYSFGSFKTSVKASTAHRLAKEAKLGRGKMVPC